MSSVGSYLRELRERRGVSLEEIARTTRVGRPYLEALEAGEFGKLPAPVFTRGFVVAYCQALGVSADEALTRYGGRVEATADANAVPTSGRERTASRGRGPVLVSFVLLIVLGLALFAVALVLQSGRDGDGRRAEVPRTPRRDALRPVPRPEPAASEEPPAVATPAVSSVTDTPGPPAVPTAPSAPTASVVATTAATAGTPTGGMPTALKELPPATISQQDITAAVGAMTAPYRLIARTSAVTWIRVRTDDGRVSDETVAAGQTREWVSNRAFTISVGNAGGVRFELNGRSLPPLGPAGAVIGRLVLPADTP